MMDRRRFLLLAPLAGLCGFLGGANPLAEKAKLREPPDDAGWEWWRNLPRTPLACSDDPVTESLCRAVTLRRDVTILYDGGSQPGATRRISPLGVFTVDGYAGTYVHAFCHMRDAERTFRVGRMTAVV